MTVLIVCIQLFSGLEEGPKPRAQDSEIPLADA